MIETAIEYINHLVTLIIAIGGVIITFIINKKFSSQKEIANNPQKENYTELRDKYISSQKGQNISQEEEPAILKKEVSNKKARHLILTIFGCLIIILLFTFISNVLKESKESEIQSFKFDINTPFEKIQDQYKILILPFYKNSNNYEIEDRLKRRFLELNEEKQLNLAVKIIPEYDITFNKAEEIGKRYNADIVLFGDFDMTANKAQLKYVIINKPIAELDNKGGTEYVKLDGISDISQGYLQEDIEDLIYWTLGMQALKRNEYQKGLEYFDNINYTDNYTIQDMVYKSKIICYIKTTNTIEITDLYLLQNRNDYLYLDLAYFCSQYLNDNELAIRLYSNELNYGKSSAIHNNIASAYANEGDYLSAEKYYKLAIQQDENAQYYFNLANLYTSDFFKRYNLSEKLYLKAIQLDSLNPDYHNYLGDFYCLDSIKKYDKAKNCFLKSIKVSPNYLQSYFNMVYLYSDYCNQFDSAKYYLNLAYKIDNNNSYVFYNYGRLYQYHSRQYEKAKKYYVKAIELDGTNAAAYDRLGDIYHYNYKMNWKAEENYRIALSISPNNSTFNNSLGILFCDEYKKYDESLSCFQKALSKKNLSNSSKAIYLTNCGNVYRNQKKYTEAEKYYLEALKYNENNLNANYNLYEIYDKTGKYKNAMIYYKNVCRINPEYKYSLYIVSLKLKQLLS